MPILWFEQHVKMSDDIADEIKMILKMPYMGQVMGIAMIIIGIIEIILFPLYKHITHLLCTNHSKISDKNNERNSLEIRAAPEISPLITDKPKNGITLIGKSEKSVLRS